ncbi:MAG: S-layer homology domain-containing protein, partial [Paenibacillus sp.]|uniref:S-layer homology domain-containing protein n=1 Tax=Paenibacillus sp. TaxID=58172 RepID=UPI0025FF098E
MMSRKHGHGFARKVLYCLLILLLTINDLAYVGAQSATGDVFKDIRFSYANYEINHLAREKIIEGYKDDTFRPDRLINREEFGTMVGRTLGLFTMKDKQVTPRRVSPWAQPWVTAIMDANIPNLLPNKSWFGAKNRITREEAIMWYVRVLGVGDKLDRVKDKPDFNDSDLISDEARSSIWLAQKLGLIYGDRDQNFNPQAYLDRQGAAVITHRVYQNIEEYKIDALKLLQSFEEPPIPPYPPDPQGPGTPDPPDPQGQGTPDPPDPSGPVTPNPPDPSGPVTPDPPDPSGPVTPDPPDPSGPVTPDPPDPSGPVTPDPPDPSGPVTPDPPDPSGPVTPDPPDPVTPDPPDPVTPDPILVPVSVTFATYTIPSAQEALGSSWRMGCSLLDAGGQYIPAHLLPGDLKIVFSDDFNILSTDGNIANVNNIPSSGSVIQGLVRITSVQKGIDFSQTFQLIVNPSGPGTPDPILVPVS